MMKEVPALVLPDGRPLVRETLRKEIAAPTRGSIRNIWAGHPADGLDPLRLGRILRDAEQGNSEAYFELAEQIEEKDPHYLSVLGTRKRAICKEPIEIIAADDSDAAQADAELLRDWLDEEILDEALFDILDAVGKGVSACEIIWGSTGGKWLPRQIKHVDPRFFEFDDLTGQELMLRDGVSHKRLPAFKFVEHRHKAKSGLTIRSGIARIAAWGYMFKNFSMKDWVIFLESYGHPLRTGRYDNNESEGNKRILANALANMGVDAYATFPKSMDVEFIDRKAGTAPSDLWLAHMSYIDDQLSKLVLGQTNTTDAKAGGMGSGQAEEHGRVRDDITDADCKPLSRTITRDIAIPIIILNHGVRDKYPKVRIGRPDEVDVAQELANATSGVALGLRIGRKQFQDRIGMPEPEPDENALGAPSSAPANDPENQMPPQGPQTPAEQQSAPDGAETASTHLLDPLKPQISPNTNGGCDDSQGQGQGQGHICSAGADQPEREPDGIDQLVTGGLEDWEQQLAPMIAPVETLIANADTLEQVRDGLTEAIAAMDESTLHDFLARAAFGTRLQAEADGQRDEAQSDGDGDGEGDGDAAPDQAGDDG